MNIPIRDWKEVWVDRMGLIVALDAERRFKALQELKAAMARELTQKQRSELLVTLAERFTSQRGVKVEVL